jgi:hypothetical protein
VRAALWFENICETSLRLWTPRLAMVLIELLEDKYRGGGTPWSITLYDLMI